MKEDYRSASMQVGIDALNQQLQKPQSVSGGSDGGRKWVDDLALSSAR